MDINLEDLIKAKKETESSGSPAPAAAAEAVAEQVEQQIMQLTPEERAQADKIREALDLTDSAAVLNFGVPAQQKIAAFADSVLSETRTKDSGPVGDMLAELVSNVRGFEKSQSGSFLEKLPLVGSLVNKAGNMKSGYMTLTAQVERVQGSLEQARDSMMKDVMLFDKLFEENLRYFKELQVYIQAGEEKLAEMREVTLPKLHAQAAASTDPMAVQVVADFEGSVERFEKKVHDLRISKTIAIQTAPQIRLIQDNDRALIDRVQTAIYSTIPLWKNQIVIALGLSQQQAVLKTQRMVTDATNELLRRNAAMLRQNTIETARENARSIVDIETVREVNENLIATIEETIKIQQESRAKRQAAEAELVQIESRLRETLLQSSGHRE